MAIANELSGDVAVAVLAHAGNEQHRDKSKLKEILVNFYSALQSLNVASRSKYVGSRAAAASASRDQAPSEKTESGNH